MNRKIAILTDSSSAIYQVNHDYDNIFMIDLPCFVGEEIYTDFMKNKDEKFYQALMNLQADQIPKTSQPSIIELQEMYERIKSLGYTDIIFLPISKELSGTYAMAYQNRDLVDGIRVEVVDTKTTASILGAIAIEAARMAKTGATVEEIVDRALAMQKRSVYYVTVNDLSFLVKNGRLSNAKSIIAKILLIKPIIILNQEGKLVSIDKGRTLKRAMSKLVEKIKQDFDPAIGVLHIAHSGVMEDLEYLKSIIAAEMPACRTEVYLIPSTIAAHLGPSSIAVAYVHY
ncbi:MAG TPA: DegV family protein [Acholeplasmataceae bacterium]|jgi:DegV family protein with EDD domain|nr:DegV family protein [Acholeplasmataceae bacterium]